MPLPRLPNVSARATVAVLPAPTQVKISRLGHRLEALDLLLDALKVPARLNAPGQPNRGT